MSKRQELEGLKGLSWDRDKWDQDVRFRLKPRLSINCVLN